VVMLKLKLITEV